MTGVSFNRGYQQLLRALSGNKALQDCSLPSLGSGKMLLAALTDTWAGFAPEQDSILDFCRRHGIKNVIWLSSDSHTSAIDDGTNAGFPELMAGNLQQRNSQIAFILENAGTLLPGTCPNANISQSFSLWNAGGQGLGNLNFSDAYGRVEVFGDDSVRLAIIDTSARTIASLTLRNGFVGALPASWRSKPLPIRLYPNPASEKVLVEIDPPLLEVPASLLLTDIGGRLLQTQVMGPTTQKQLVSLPVSHLGPGLYIIVLQTMRGPYTLHFVRP